MKFTILDHSTFTDPRYMDENKLLFDTLEWINFIKRDKNARPIVIKIESNNSVWFFPCLIFKKGIFSFIGSPFSGWSTPYMDLVGNDSIPDNLYKELTNFLKIKYHPVLIEILHSKVSERHLKNLKYKKVETLDLDLSLSEEELFKGFKQDARNFIRQFEKRGARLEIVKDFSDFPEIFYTQLVDVFAKQGMRPSYSKHKVINLINALKDTDKLLCLKVLDPNNKCIASSIFIGYKDTFYFWGGASYREHQHYRPNEYMIWFAIKYWKKRGFKSFDMVGVRDYKKKFGPVIKDEYRIYSSAFPFMVNLRNFIEKIYYRRLRRNK